MPLLSIQQPQEPHAQAHVNGVRQRVIEAPTGRVRLDGKFFRLGDEKFHVRGVTYGPFEPTADGPFHTREQTKRDFDQILELNANCLRIYHAPPQWFLDLAQDMGLKVFLDVAWPKNLEFIASTQVADQARAAVREAAEQCGNHPALFALSVANEIPADMVRLMNPRRVELFIDELVQIAREEAPACLVTFANYPTTEYLRPSSPDFVCFNVYLHNGQTFRNYLSRLQNIARDKPLMLGEYGIDTHQEFDETKQAELVADHVRAVFDEGLAGTFVFSFTDDWFVHGYPIRDWAFGLVRRDRSHKPAFEAVRQLYASAPQITNTPLPKASIIVCSYNGAGTVETCLRSMRRLKYPDYEVIFVDDGSTDDTPDILRRFPEVRYIRQRNMGLSHARNVGLAAATGEVVVYTDSDCEADEDWLYYLVLNLVRSTHVGMGGPNLIPDEGSWIADCVGLSPGGPTHVMIDDRTAEHVPGCNMAYYTWAARQINGFDPQFRSAGDDVDFIWRLQQQGWSIGFAPAAQVWHYRRNTVKAYLKQQRGYGTAEALLKYKHPDRFNALGASHWHGRIYGGELIGARFGTDVIYHGTFGTGLFQTIYRRPASLTAMMLMSVEWLLLSAFVALLGLAFSPLLWVSLVMIVTPMILAMIAAAQAPMPRHHHPLSRPLIAYLHYRQPITRGWARYSVRLKAKVMKHVLGGYVHQGALPFDSSDPRTLKYWSRVHDRMTLLEALQREIDAAGWRYRLDSGWGGWDIEIYASRYVKVRLITATEHHHGVGMLSRVKIEARMTKFCAVLFGAALLMAGWLLLYLWPFSRPAILIPLAWWAMFVVNRYHVLDPVLGLIDHVARKAGYYPVWDPTPAPNESTVPGGLEETEPSIA